MGRDFDKPYPDLCFLGELVFRPSLTSLQGQGAEVGSNFIPFEGMEFDATVSLLPCWGWRGAKSTRLVMGFSLAFEIFGHRHRHRHRQSYKTRMIMCLLF